MEKIKFIFIGGILIIIFSAAIFAQSPRRNSSQGISPSVGVDKRIELLAIIWRLAVPVFDREVCSRISRKLINILRRTAITRRS